MFISDGVVLSQCLNLTVFATCEAVYFLLHNIYQFSSYLTGNTTSPFCNQELLTTRPQRRSTFLHVTYQFSSYLTGNNISHFCSQELLAPDHSAVYFLLHNIYQFSSYLTGNTVHLRSVARNSDH
jgi:hypothetical protein